MLECADVATGAAAGKPTAFGLLRVGRDPEEDDARTLLSMARSNSAKSQVQSDSSNRTRIAKMFLSLRGAF